MMAHTTLSHFFHGLDFFLTSDEGNTHQVNRAMITLSTIPVIKNEKGAD